MAKRFILVLLFLPISLLCKEWALENITDGWNTRQLVIQYFHNSAPQTHWAWQALSHYHFRGDEKVLDFGSGDGKLSALMSFLVPDGSVMGIDISKEMVAFADKMFPHKCYKNLAFLTSEDIDFSMSSFSDKFDIVTSFCVFHLIPNPEKVLANIHSMMRPSGKLIVTLPISGNVQFYHAATKAMAKRGWDYPSLREITKEMRDPKKIKEVFAQAGFEMEYFEIVETRDSFGSKEELIDWFEGTLSANWNIPREGRREFFTELADLYLHYQPRDQDKDGFVYFTVKRVDLIAVPTGKVSRETLS